MKLKRLWTGTELKHSKDNSELILLESLTSCEEPGVVLTEGSERRWQGGEGGQRPLLEGPEAGVERIYLQCPLAVEGALLGQLQNFKGQLQGEEARTHSHRPVPRLLSRGSQHSNYICSTSGLRTRVP